MKWMRWVEFFEGKNNLLSMTRLLCFMSWFPATYVVLKSESENILGWYLGSFVIGFVGGKLGDCINRKGGNNAGD